MNQPEPPNESRQDLDFLDDLFADLFDTEDISSDSDQVPDLGTILL